MKIFSDKKRNRRIISILIGVVSVVSIVMSIWYITQNMRHMRAESEAQAVVQGEEDTLTNPQVPNPSTESDNADNTNTEDADMENADTNPLGMNNADGPSADMANADGNPPGMNSADEPSTDISNTETEDMYVDGMEPTDMEFEDEVYGNLIITNRVESKSEEEIDPEKEFYFTIHVGEEVYRYALRAGESYSIENIPTGVFYKVEAAEYLDEYYVNENRQFEGNIMLDDNYIEVMYVLTPEEEVTQRIEAGEFIIHIEQEENIENIENMQESVEVMQDEDVLDNVSILVQEQENLRYEGEISLSTEAHPMIITFWLVALILSTIMLKFVVFRPWLKHS